MYEAIINEAHKNGMRVVAHIFSLEDGKQLLKSGVEGLPARNASRRAALRKTFTKAYTEPFPVRVDQRIILDNEMIEFICAENDESVHMVGK